MPNSSKDPELSSRAFAIFFIVTTLVAITLLFEPKAAAAGTDSSWKGPSPGTTTAPTSGNWSTPENWSPTGKPTSDDGTILRFGGSGSTAYMSFEDITFNPFTFGSIILDSTATVTNVIDGNDLAVGIFGSRIQQNGSGQFLIDNRIFGQNTGTGTSTTELNLTGDGTGRVTLSNTLADFNAQRLALLKNGGSTFVITSSSNTYSGGTTVSAGTLLANNFAGSATGSGAVTVNGTGTLGGTGRIDVSGPLLVTDRTVTVNSAGTINAGDGPNQIGKLTLQATTVSFGTGGTFLVDINSSTSDLLQIFGTLNLSALGDILKFNQLATPTAALYTLATYTGEVSRFETVTNLPDGYTLVYGPTALQLVMTPVPEPSTWLGGALALAAVGFTQRRRFSRLVRRTA